MNSEYVGLQIYRSEYLDAKVKIGKESFTL